MRNRSTIFPTRAASSPESPSLPNSSSVTAPSEPSASSAACPVSDSADNPTTASSRASSMSWPTSGIVPITVFASYVTSRAASAAMSAAASGASATCSSVKVRLRCCFNAMNIVRTPGSCA
jgi:hypothetical protein